MFAGRFSRSGSKCASPRDLRTGGNTRTKTPGRRPLRVEPLEDRRLLSIPSGKVLFLDNVNAYAEAADSASLDLGVPVTASISDISIEASFYVPDTARDGTEQLVSKAGAYELAVEFYNGAADYVSFSVVDPVAGTVSVTGTQEFAAGWHSVMAVFTQTTAGDYLVVVVDEEILAVSPALDFTAGVADSSSPVVVGAFSEPVGPIIGRAITRIDEVRLSRVDRYDPAAYPEGPFETDSYTQALWHFDASIVDPPAYTAFPDDSGYDNVLVSQGGAYLGSPLDDPLGVSRLFAVPFDSSSQIVELDPDDGSEINRFAAPETALLGPEGLAYDGEHLFFLAGYGSDTLWELDPDTGDVIDNDAISAGSGGYDGLAALNGKIYILDYFASDILEFDPGTDTVTAILDIDGLNSGVSQIMGGIAGIQDPAALVVTDNGYQNVFEIDPTTGLVSSSFPTVGVIGGVAVLDGEIYLGALDGTSRIDVFSREGDFERTFSLPYFVTALGGDGVGGLSTRGTISGTVWTDMNGNGLQDSGEPGMADVTVYLDLNENGRFDSYTLEPDDYEQGELLNTVLPEVTLSALGTSDGYVFAMDEGYPSTREHVFANQSSMTWSSWGPQLRMDFTDPVEVVSIDFISSNSNATGRLDVYDTADNLLGTFTTAGLTYSERATMTQSRPTADIAYAIAYGDNSYGLLDHLTFAHFNEPFVETDQDGAYTFDHLEEGSYTVSQVLPAGWEQTTPAGSPPAPSSSGRLFSLGTSGTAATIYELSPADGSVLNSFLAPESVSVVGYQGLALGPDSLFFLDRSDNDSHTLWELDFDTGAVLDSDTMPVGSITGLAYLDGLVYVDDNSGATGISAWDPVADTLVSQFSVNANLGGGLTGAADLGLLFASTWAGEILAIAPSDGTLVGTPLTPLVDLPCAGLAYLNGQLIAASYGPGATALQIDPEAGTILGSFTIGASGLLSGLAADGIDATNVQLASYVVELGAGESINGLDFGNFSELDFGDAPSPYPTLLEDGGAVHAASGPRLGATRDAEVDGQPDVNAAGDNGNGLDDEDGVVFSVLTASTSNTTSANIHVTLQNADALGNYLDAWIDFNQDGDWDDAGEQVFTSFDLGQCDARWSLWFDIPQAVDGAVAYGTTYARFRVSTTGGLSPTGLALDGEVEDYPVTITWFDSSEVLNANADSDTGDDSLPQVMGDGWGNWIAVWESGDSLDGTIGTDYDILVARSTDAGLTWSSPVALNTNADQDAGSDITPTIATDDAGNWVVVWSSYDTLDGTLRQDGDIFVSRSTDAGFTWSDPVALNTNAATDTGHDFWPQVSTDGSGNWVTAWLSTDSLGGTIGTDCDILVSRSTDAGATWSAPAPLNANADSDTGNDYAPQVVADGTGRWLALWESNDSLDGAIGTDRDVLVASSLDGGLTWSDPAPLNSNAASDSGDDSWPRLATDEAGAWVAVWYSYDSLGGTIGSDADVLVARSTDGGVTWTAPAPLNTNAGLDSNADLTPSIATDTMGNWVVAWASYEDLTGTLGTDADIFVSRSDDGGLTWSDPAPGDTYAVYDSEDDTNPQIQTDRTGTWLIVWSSPDRRGGLSGVDSDILRVKFGEPILDYGDAPSAYPSLLADNGARHLATGPRLGAYRDSELDGQPRSDALGDDWNNSPDDEDGVKLPVMIASTSEPTITNLEVDLQNADSVGNYLDAWIDFNQDGDWDDPGEQVLNAYDLGTSSGTQSVPITVPRIVDDNVLYGTTYARFRVSTVGGLSPLGYAADGEVEDLAVSIAWFGPTEAFASNASSDSGSDRSPRLTTDGQGNWLAVWESYDTLSGTIGTDGDILVSRSTDGGFSWTAPAALNTNAATDSGSDRLPEVASDGNGNWIAVWYSSDRLGDTIGYDDDILFARSSDGGVTWTDPMPLNTDAGTDTVNDCCPQVTTDGMGNWITVWYSANSLGGTIGADTDIFFACSSDAGLTWTDPAPLNSDAATDTGSDIGPQLTTDGEGNWLAVWSSDENLGGAIGSDRDILFSRSTDAGVTWSDAAALNTNASTDSGADGSPRIFFDGAGIWLAVWSSSDTLGGTIGTDTDILISRSSDAGQTWTAPAALVSKAASDSAYDFSPQLATDGTGNWMAVWGSNDVQSGALGHDCDILVSRSRDGGASWTPAVPLNTNATIDSSTDDSPYIAADGSGNWLALWRSEDSLGGTIGADYDILIGRFSETLFDFGDAPTEYSTLLVDDGARHQATGPTLGALRDTEADGFPDALAAGDDTNLGDDEDGLVALSLLAPGLRDAYIDVEASEASYLNAWIDFNGDGDWADPGEQIAVDLPMAAGLNRVAFDVPVSALPGDTYARFRLTSYDTEGSLAPSGVADDGEVEDYCFTIDDTLYLYGESEGDDTIRVMAGVAGTSLHQVNINGMTTTVDPAVIGTICIDAFDGNDTITIEGTDGEEEATLLPGNLALLGPGYAIYGQNVENITVDGKGGADEVNLTGSTGSNRLFSYPDSTRLSDTPGTYSFRVDGFETVAVDGSAGEDNYAFLYDSEANDVLTASPAAVELNREDGTILRSLAGFEKVYAYATDGGTDTAALIGADGARNRLTSYADHTTLTESGRSFYFYAEGFDSVSADSPGSSTSYAYLYDSEGDDTLQATPDSATMARGSSWPDVTATGFARVYAYATQGGDDSAILTGSETGGNRYRGYPAYSTLTDASGSFYHYARGFDSVAATGSQSDSSGDRAWLYDSSGDDTLAAAVLENGKYQGAVLSDDAGTYENQVLYFDLVYARSSDTGTNDTIDVDEEELAYDLLRRGSW